MGLRDNRAELIGPLRLDQEVPVRLGNGLRVPALFGYVSTYVFGLTVDHLVVFVGRLAREVEIFCEELGEGIEVRVDGYLLPAQGRTWVVADNVTFLVPGEARRWVVERLRNDDGLSGQVRLSGESMRELLQAILESRRLPPPSGAAPFWAPGGGLG